ncbi:MAG TPA: GWxTD domain-containing protein, partial [Candidatus Acidoferrales bacterium]|nr:GWxTD domain-containing protein [Candidatus Acidoferrales bacterium]
LSARLKEGFPVLSRHPRFYIAFLLAALVSSGSFAVQAQEKDSKSDSSAQAQPDGQQDPLKRPRKKDDQSATKEKLGGVYKKWLDEDVRWIITDEELSAFKKLQNNSERDTFIEGFWQRRDPTPDTAENEYKEEHYRRIAYANEHFAAGMPGWRTDRGRIYIMFGPPTSIDAHPMGGPYQRPAEEGGGQTETFPFEVWRYRYLEGIGQEVEIEFVDDCNCGAYEMTLDRSKKDALLHVPNAGLTTMEEMGMANKAQRFNGGLESLGAGPFTQGNQSKQFDRMETFAKLNRAPDIKFKDLQNELVTHKFRTNLLPFDVQVDFVKLTSDTVLVPITLQVPLKGLTFVNKDGIQRAVVNVYGQLTKLSGQIVQTFEETLHRDIPAELLEKEINNVSLYWKALPMRPGLYRLDVVMKDVNGDKTGIFSRSYTVPDFGDEKLTSSTLILADQMEPVPAREVGTGNFVIGTNKVRPKVGSADGKPAAFKQKEKINFWLQVYNLGVDQKTNKPSATVEYQVVNTATNKHVLDFTESTAQMGNIGEQVTLGKSLQLSQLDPGIYQVTIKVNDQISKQTISPTAKFAVQQ